MNYFGFEMSIKDILGVLHTNEEQNVRYWPHHEKFDGLNGNFMAFIYEVIKQISYTKEMAKEGSRNHKIQERAMKYLQIIYNWNLASLSELQNDPRILKYRQAIREIPLPNPRRAPGSKKIVEQRQVLQEDGSMNVVNVEVELTSDIEEPIEECKPGSWPKGWLPNKDEREVAMYLLKVLEGAITGPALEVIVSMGNPKDRNGFMVLERLAEVYGRTAAHIAMMPQMFTWGQAETLAHDWVNYKMMLETSQYHKLHPGNDAIMVQSALAGFMKYQHYHRLHDHLRVQCGDDATWDVFRDHVDRFIGDVHKNAFQQSILKNERGVAVMTAANILSSPTGINHVHNSFRPIKPVKKIDKMDVDSTGDGVKKPKNDQKINNNKKLNVKTNSQTGTSSPSSANANGKWKKKEKTTPIENKKGARQCAWCGDTSHKYWNCTTYGNGKWKDRTCNRCEGRGHPSEACCNPPKSK